MEQYYTDYKMIECHSSTIVNNDMDVILTIDEVVDICKTKYITALFEYTGEDENLIITMLYIGDSIKEAIEIHNRIYNAMMEEYE